MRIGTVVALLLTGCFASPAFAQTTLPNPSSLPPAPITATLDPPATNPFAPPPGTSYTGISPLQTIADAATANRVWFNAEYLLWFVRGESTPPLITAFPGAAASATSPVPLTSTTAYPYDGQRIQYHMFNGLRLSGGWWFSEEPRLGIDASFFYLDQNTNGASFASPGAGAAFGLSRPINNGTATNLIFATPNLPLPFAGSVSAASTVSDLYGADANLRVNAGAVIADSVDYLFGLRYLNFREQLTITGQSTLPSSNKFLVSDRFQTTNQFYGAQVGFDTHWFSVSGFSLDSTIKMALGAVEQQATISGYNTVTSSTGVVTYQPRGLYAQSSNIGSYERGVFGFLPEINLKGSYHFNNYSSVFFGYNVLWINSVARPGSEINPTVSNINYKPGVPLPAIAEPSFTFHHDSFWVQGFNMGFQLRY